MNPRLHRLLDFLRQSPTPYHACRTLQQRFHAAGFTSLHERDSWMLQTGGRYFYTRSDSSFVAFVVGADFVRGGLRILGTHTDSPCLKLKPQPELREKGLLRLGVEVYGGALLNPWFDRDLSLAGKVTGVDDEGNLCSALIDFNRAIASIPSLAIHLDRDVNSNKSVNAQKEMNAILTLNSERNLQDVLLGQVRDDAPNLNMEKVLDFNLSFYDVQPPALIGLEDEFIASARLDNLLSTFIAADILLHTETDQSCVLICNDHEEVGSRSENGAQGTLLKDLLERLMEDDESRQRVLRQSMMVSIDNAHALHPNYPEKHDVNHGPSMNGGPVLKFNANQSYATSSDTAALLRVLAQRDNIPLQSFAVRADMQCGSTIGPITASNVGVKTADIGIAQLAMHSVREIAGVKDVEYLAQLLRHFLMCDSVAFDH